MIKPDALFGRLGNRLFQMAYIYAQVKEGKLNDIYAQDYRLFEKYEKEIKTWFGERIGYLPYVAIQLRRGDYVNNPFYVDLAQTGYYIDATNLFPGRKFLIFSDDVPFAKTYFEGDKFAFDDSDNEIDAFNRMASCDSHIIANSSFSYWAGYLSPTLTKKVIAPTSDKWYKDGVERTICPPEWIRV
jgi:hypothetical protein